MPAAPSLLTFKLEATPDDRQLLRTDPRLLHRIFIRSEHAGTDHTVGRLIDHPPITLPFAKLSTALSVASLLRARGIEINDELARLARRQRGGH